MTSATRGTASSAAPQSTGQQRQGDAGNDREGFHHGHADGDARGRIGAIIPCRAASVPGQQPKPHGFRADYAGLPRLRQTGAAGLFFFAHVPFGKPASTFPGHHTARHQNWFTIKGDHHGRGPRQSERQTEGPRRAGHRRQPRHRRGHRRAPGHGGRQAWSSPRAPPRAARAGCRARCTRRSSASSKAGGEATFIKADLAQAGERERLVEEAVAAYGPVDILVNNAAITYFIPVVTSPRSASS